MKIYPLLLALIGLGACVHPQKKVSIEEAFQNLEASSGARLGISAREIKSGRVINYRSDEMFPFCSTFKTMVVAAVLKQSEETPGLLEKKISVTQASVEGMGHSPVTSPKIGAQMSVAELSAATIQYSDNPAVNLLVKEIGGLSAVNTFAREIGDETFRLDRWEPDLNSAVPGDPRDTTTPKAMEQSLRRLFVEDMLGAKEKKLFIDWHKGNTTGDKRIRAAAPKAWIVADKTGTCAYGSTNDIGIVWKPNGDPIVLAIYLTHADAKATHKDSVVADAAKLVLESLK